MNRLAVALATDSAATVSDGRRDKVYNSANKLFMLSRRHPVGIMVYSNSALLGVPWETLIKLFRDEMGDEECDRVEQYVDKLIAFLQRSLWMFPADSQREYAEDLARALYAHLDVLIAQQIKVQLDQFARAALSPARQKQREREIAEAVIHRERVAWDQKPNSPSISRALADQIYTSGSGSFNDIAVGKLGNIFQLRGEAMIDLKELILSVISKAEVAPFLRSGVVISGFGKREIYPAFRHVHFGGIFRDIIKVADVSKGAVTNQAPADIKTFADSGMAKFFLQGITPLLETSLLELTFRTVTLMTNQVIDSVPRISLRRKKQFKEDLRPLQREAAKTWLDASRAIQLESHFRAVREGITNAAVDQLAHVAASLVNLDSFKKKMSLQPETVGGPVDVAVITKGDGFVWIERKHYFKPELNGHYFRNAQRVLKEDQAREELEHGGTNGEGPGTGGSA